MLLLQPRQPDRVQGFVYACANLVGPHTEIFQGKGNFMFDRRGGELCLWVLEHDAHCAGQYTDGVFKRVQAAYADRTIEFSAEKLGHNPD
jgi:hypothetical protein